MEKFIFEIDASSKTSTVAIAIGKRILENYTILMTLLDLQNFIRIVQVLKVVMSFLNQLPCTLDDLNLF